MTIIEAINGIDTLKPNTYTQEQKIAWLSALDGRMKADVIDTHEGGEKVVFEGYNEATDPDTPLIITAPYDEVYITYLEMKIDFANAEYDKYNNSAYLFNSQLDEYKKYYNRTHMPKGIPILY